MRRWLIAPVAVLLSGAFFGGAPGPAAAQTTSSVRLTLLSQSAWNEVGRPLQLSFEATNTSGAPLDDLSVELIVEAPATSRSLYELSLTQDFATLIATPFPQRGALAPGQSRPFHI